MTHSLTTTPSTFPFPVNQSLRDAEEKELLAQILGHNELAWVELLRRYHALIYRCIGRILFKHAPQLTADDLSEVYAEVCLQLFRDNMHKLRVWNPNKGSRLSTWIGLIATHTAYDYLRSLKRRSQIENSDEIAEEPVSDSNPLDTLIDRERWSQVNHLLAGFSDRDRCFVEMYYGSGLLPEQIAEKLGISIKTVYSKKNKIRSRLAALASSVEPTVTLAA